MGKEFMEQIREIYGLLGDDLSKEVWGRRLLYSLTGDARCIREIICSRDVGNAMYCRMKNTDKSRVIFGAGEIGKKLLHFFDDIEFECFVDNKHAGKVCEGLPVVDIQTLKSKYNDSLIIISTAKYQKEILSQLIEEGFKEENIVNIGEEYEKLNHLQYFDLPELEQNIKSKEVFVDGGCYDGTNVKEFQRWSERNGVEETFAYAWEPDPKSMKVCKKTLDACEIPHEMVDKGVWSKQDTLYFESDEKSSAISSSGTIAVEVDSIDNIIKQPVSYIKLDVEGSEYQALLGAEETIKKYKPKLAICIYHKPEDVWELPLLVHQMNPEYKFYVRHYSFADNETVLYAI